MQHFLITPLILFLLIFVNSESVRAQAGDPCEGLPEWKFFVEAPGTSAIIDPDEIEDPQIIDALIEELGFGPVGEREELVGLLVRLNENPLQVFPDLPSQLQGVSGFVTALFLQRHLDSNGFSIVNLDQSIAPKIVSGKIRDFIIERDPGNANRASGHLSVDVCTKNEKTEARQFFHWDIEVSDNQYSIKEQKSPDPNRPELDHKLGARGGAIEVKHVYFRDLANPNVVRIPRGSGQMYYDSTPGSCVDLFTAGPPRETYGELVEQGFCLGRCAHPLIINTGGE